MIFIKSKINTMQVFAVFDLIGIDYIDAQLTGLYTSFDKIIEARESCRKELEQSKIDNEDDNEELYADMFMLKIFIVDIGCNEISYWKWSHTDNKYIMDNRF